MQDVSSPHRIDPFACLGLVLALFAPPVGLVVASIVLRSDRGRDGTALTRWVLIASVMIGAVGLALALSLWGGLLFDWGFTTSTS